MRMTANSFLSSNRNASLPECASTMFWPSGVENRIQGQQFVVAVVHQQNVHFAVQLPDGLAVVRAVLMRMIRRMSRAVLPGCGRIRRRSNFVRWLR